VPASGGHPNGFRSVPWQLTYDTGAPGPNGAPVDILRNFYVPALSRAVAYDRVAGYFRSTSLAAAAQGFEAFVRHQGKIRLVVGADLDPADVAAILRGEEARRDARFSLRSASPRVGRRTCARASVSSPGWSPVSA
jgi:hypothetical protein